MPYKQSFEDWWRDVRIIARLLGFKKKQCDTLDQAAWKEDYYEQDFTPAQAWQSENECG